MGGGAVAAQALTQIIGDKALREAVDFYITGAPGFELARSVLRMLKPPAAMNRCREIFRDSTDDEEAGAAIELLRVVADKRVLDWVPEFLSSSNRSARIWGVGVIDQLWMDGEIEPEEGRALVEEALNDSDQAVREQAQQLHGMWDADSAN